VKSLFFTDPHGYIPIIYPQYSKVYIPIVTMRNHYQSQFEGTWEESRCLLLAAAVEEAWEPMK